MIQTLILILMASLGSQDAAPATQPLPCDHPELRQIEFLRGTWTVNGSWLGPDGVMKPVHGESVFSSELGGCLIAERLHGTKESEPFETFVLFAYNSIQGRFEQVRSDSLHGSLLTSSGSAGQDSLELEAEIQLSRLINLRQTYRYSGQTMVVETKRQFDRSDVWTTVWKATYTKTSR